jgi:hypothetical protein
VVEVELHQLTLRYERLRKRHPRAERALLSSLAEIGQQTPVVVVGEAERFVLIDGYKRVHALRRLARDVVLVTRWELEEVEALLLERGLRRGSEDALDQAWLLAELQERFAYSLEELARRFEHSKSWLGERSAGADPMSAWLSSGAGASRGTQRARGDEVSGADGTHGGCRGRETGRRDRAAEADDARGGNAVCGLAVRQHPHA